MLRRIITVPLCSLLACTASGGDDGGTPSTGSASSGVSSASEDSGDGEGGSSMGEEGDGTSMDTGADTAGDEGEDDEGFVPGTDTPAVTMCDPFAQDCPEGEKCVPFVSGIDETWEANRCVPISGDKTEGDTCTVSDLLQPIDDCDANHLCWQLVWVDGTLEGQCLPFCAGSSSSPTCNDDRICQVTNDGSVNVCMETCDPLAAECPEGTGCYISGGQEFFICQPVSGGYEEGAACVYTNDCVPGLFCAAGDTVPNCETGGCCTTYCDLGDTNPCAEGTECVAFFDPAPPGYTSLGVCVIPG